MKKRKGIVILLVLFLCVTIIVIIGVVKNPKKEKIKLDSDKIVYMKISRHIEKSAINNKEAINKVIDELGSVEIEQYHPFIEFIEENKHGSTKNAIKIELYEDKDSVVPDKTISVISSDHLKINGKLYKICDSKNNLYEQMKEIFMTGGSMITVINKDDIEKIENNGFDGYSEDDIFQLYINSYKSMPIESQKYQESDKYILIKLKSGEEIRINSIDDQYFISSKKGDEISYFKN